MQGSESILYININVICMNVCLFYLLNAVHSVSYDLITGQDEALTRDLHLPPYTDTHTQNIMYVL